MKKGLVLIAAASLVLSCSEKPPIQELEKIPINISVGLQTRANDSAFENEDEIGLYVVNYDGETAGTLKSEGNQVNNVQFTYDGSSWNSTEDIYWKDQNTSADFYAYYPYSASITSVTAHAFGVQADQSVEDSFWASDFLWGKSAKVSPTPMAVPIKTSHVFSRIVLDIKPGNGFTDDAWEAATKSVSIQEVKTSATIDLSTGVATATGSAGSVIPFAYSASGTTVTYRAMIVPQVVEDNSKLVVVTVDGVDYVYRKGFTFNANTEYKFAVTVNKTEGGVDMSIGEWTIDENLNEGEAVEESNSGIPNNEIWYSATSSMRISEYQDIANGKITSHTYDESKGLGIITFNQDITELAEEAFMGESIKSITLPNSITKILDYAFQNCKQLVSVTLPNSITSIPLCAFEGCAKLNDITIPNSVTKIYESAFDSCSSLTNIIIPNNVTFIGMSAFNGCSSITSITIPNNVTKIGMYAFLDCESLKSVYCKSNTPPGPPDYSSTDWNIFGSNVSGLKIYVPASDDDSVITAYKAATLWNKYADYIEEKEM